ncbi:hypothetical protein ACHAW5_008074 [Stephanodiscus triporus]|uniref:Protein kinase domain-containing protein n=1 Tax=Stephanodiscus triporus TaxID=2934178 RepID=A0ABD3PTK0_9STRA
MATKTLAMTTSHHPTPSPTPARERQQQPQPQPQPQPSSPSNQTPAPARQRQKSQQPSSNQMQMRRRPTSYTFTAPSPSQLSQLIGEDRHHRSGSGGGGRQIRRTTVQSLDRSEEDGDSRRRHLGLQPRRHSSHDRHVVGQRQHEQLERQYERQQQERQQHQRRPRSAQGEDQSGEQTGGGRGHGHPQDLRRTSSSGGGKKATSSSSSSPSSFSSSGGQLGGVDLVNRIARGVATASAPPFSSHARSSAVSREKESRRNSGDSSSSSASSEMRDERRRLEEYAGRRALERLEKELEDHSEGGGRAKARRNASSSSVGGRKGCIEGDDCAGYPTGRGAPSTRTNLTPGDDSRCRHRIKNVMNRRKLARVPQVKKTDLVIGEYLGRGNFCDVFEVKWELPTEKRNGGSIPGQSYASESWRRTTTTMKQDNNDDFESSEDTVLSCSNDLSLVVIDGNGRASSNRSANLRSVSQVRVEGTAVWNGGVPSTSRNRNVLALKCLRPAVRAQPRKFIIGAEDLAHETAILACLDHPNIIQLHGRAEGCFSTAFQMSSPEREGGEGGGGGGKRQISNEGYFIILDRLMATLTDRIDEWRNECHAIALPPHPAPMRAPHPESMLREHLRGRLKVAYSIADALGYLHSRHVVFRDLKPANIGFDHNDCVKVFDFGFATSIAPLLSRPYAGYGPLTETCGTRRYMAPEVALQLGYGKEVDVYSFGMLLWEVCALDKPFDSIKSVDEFHDIVVLYGKRPSLHIDPLWPSSLKSLMTLCWSTDPLDRPTMVKVKSMLCSVLRDVNEAGTEKNESSNGRAKDDGGKGGQGGTQQKRQEQGGNFIDKIRRRVSL